MNEYIKREELAIEFMYADADVVEDYGDGECEWGFSRKRIQEVINSVPSDDVSPVLHGRWVQGNGHVECSECNTIGSPHWKCCPVCTAMMDLEVTNGS